jgi:diaminopimelate epimerase
MKIRFQKMHFLSNDFVVINGIKHVFKPTSKLIRQWANRRRGIGFDQLLLIEKPRHQQTHFHYRIFNANGNEVAQCGNGALCIAQFLSKEKLSTENPLLITTKNSSLQLQLDKNQTVTANLGIPIFDPKKIPFMSFTQGPIHPIETPFGRFDCCVLSLGNPHCVLQVDNLENAPLEQVGAYLNQAPHSYFPQGINVGFMKILNPKHISLRVYERDVGETQACGSGACAAVITGRLLQRLAHNVKVDLPGGQVNVKWQEILSPVLLTGKGETIFQGEIDSP